MPWKTWFIIALICTIIEYLLYIVSIKYGSRPSYIALILAIVWGIWTLICAYKARDY